MPLFDVVIPARDEASTIGPVVRSARRARGVGEVIVVNDGSSDNTAEVATEAGARVVPSNGSGSKARALATGMEQTRSDVLVFFDADILGSLPEHFEALATPVIEEDFMMCCGLVDYGRLRNGLFLRLPPITGLRAVRREVFDAVPEQKRNGFQIEIMINEVIARGGLLTAIRLLSGTGHRSKVDKNGWLKGGRSHLAMTLELLECFRLVPLWTYRSYLRSLSVLPPSGMAMDERSNMQGEIESEPGPDS